MTGWTRTLRPCKDDVKLKVMVVSQEDKGEEAKHDGTNETGMWIGKFNAKHPPMTCFGRGKAMAFGEFGSSLLYEFRIRGSREIMRSQARFFQTSETDCMTPKR